MDKGVLPDNRKLKWLICGLIFANLFVWLAMLQNLSGRYLEVSYFDIGQGDAAFIQSPRGVQMLVDGGPDSGILEKLGQAMPFYDRDIDWLVLSHPDRDHLSGLLAVLENYRVHNIIWSGISKDSAESDKWIDLISKEGANIIAGAAGDEFDLGGEPHLIIKILAPEADVTPGDGSNEISLAVELKYGQRDFIFIGDADSEEEQEIIDLNSGLRADILKVAHHGSKYSANEEFISQTLPAAAVISVGAQNSYGHPNDVILEMLEKYGIKTLRTDQNGDIVFRTDGTSLFVKTQK